MSRGVLSCELPKTVIQSLTELWRITPLLFTIRAFTEYYQALQTLPFFSGCSYAERWPAYSQPHRQMAFGSTVTTNLFTLPRFTDDIKIILKVTFSFVGTDFFVIRNIIHKENTESQEGLGWNQYFLRSLS